MKFNIEFNPWISLIFGFLILIFPGFLNFLVAFYLIIVGILGIIKHGRF